MKIYPYDSIFQNAEAYDEVLRRINNMKDDRVRPLDVQYQRRKRVDEEINKWIDKYLKRKLTKENAKKDNNA